MDWGIEAQRLFECEIKDEIVDWCGVGNVGQTYLSSPWFGYYFCNLRCDTRRFDYFEHDLQGWANLPYWFWTQLCQEFNRR